MKISAASPPVGWTNDATTDGRTTEVVALNFGEGETCRLAGWLDGWLTSGRWSGWDGMGWCCLVVGALLVYIYAYGRSLVSGTATTECDDTHGQLMHVVRESEDGDERRVVVGAENGLRR